MTAGRLALLTLGACAVAARRGNLVRVVRALDRRGALFTAHATGVYAKASFIVSGLHRRVAADAAAALGGREATVIDVGSGPGDLLLRLRGLVPAANLIGIEPSAAMRSIAAGRGITTVDGAAEHLPFADGTVDLVLSTLSSHHWDDPAAAFAEIRRVLRPGGEARIYDVRFAGYGPDEARALAQAAGFAPGAMDRRILDERLLGLRPYSLITLRPWERRDV